LPYRFFLGGGGLQCSSQGEHRRARRLWFAFMAAHPEWCADGSGEMPVAT
jgi:hypothetical protein